MVTASRLFLLLALAASGASCRSEGHQEPEHRGFVMAPVGPPAPRVCTFGADQTCNDDSLLSSVQGSCNQDGSCTCHPGFQVDPRSGRCK